VPLLPIAKELRRIKRQEDLEEFERFEAAFGKAVWDEVLKVRREAEGNPGQAKAFACDYFSLHYFWECTRWTPNFADNFTAIKKNLSGPRLRPQVNVGGMSLALRPHPYFCSCPVPLWNHSRNFSRIASHRN
jgi:hypothetical protein